MSGLSVAVTASLSVAMLLGGLRQPAAATSEPDDRPREATASAADATTRSLARGSGSFPDPSGPSGSSIRTDLLLGVSLTVEEVHHGVYRVLGDGVRDLSTLTVSEIFSGRDGSLWLRKQDRSIKLGQPGSLQGPFATGRFEVAPDGTVWTIGWQPGDAGQTLYSFDGISWTAHDPPAHQGRSYWEPWDLEIAADGKVWAVWDTKSPRGSRVARLDPDGWHLLTGLRQLLVGDLVVTDADDVWLQRGAERHQRGRWRSLRPWATRGWVGRGGTVWLRRASGGFLRFNGGSRQRCLTDGPPGQFRPRAEGISVGLDGSLWGHYRPGAGSVELARFDCSAWHYPLPGVDVGVRKDVAFADDGSVWVLSDFQVRSELVGVVPPGGGKLRQLYVITSSAEAARSLSAGLPVPSPPIPGEGGA